MRSDSLYSSIIYNIIDDEYKEDDDIKILVHKNKSYKKI